MIGATYHRHRDRISGVHKFLPDAETSRGERGRLAQMVEPRRRITPGLVAVQR